MKLIKLTKNQESIVDDDYYEILNKYKWRVSIQKKCKYAVREINSGNGNSRNTRKNQLMHRYIIELTGHNIKNKIIDHINGYGLDNRIINLRICNQQQNSFNRKKQKNTSGYKGVSYDKNRKKYFCKIQINGKQKFLGRFIDEVVAAKAYDVAAIKYFGEFACLNF